MRRPDPRVGYAGQIESKMPRLNNTRWERFAAAYAGGMTEVDAYHAAGFKQQPGTTAVRADMV